jgi:hypothetical protein
MGVEMNTQAMISDTNSKNVLKSIKVCVIGNSHIGAIKRAYESDDIVSNPYEFFFFARPGKNFAELTIQNGVINGAIYFDKTASFSVDDYSVAIVYGAFPLPEQVLDFFKSLSSDNYSTAVRKASLLNWMMYYHGCKLASALAARPQLKVFVLSRNYATDMRVAAQAELSEGRALIQEMIQPASYIPAAKDLFSETGIPRTDFYNGSLNVLGEEPDRSEQPLHHVDHLNLSGGKVVLAAIIDSLREG